MIDNIIIIKIMYIYVYYCSSVCVYLHLYIFNNKIKFDQITMWDPVQMINNNIFICRYIM